MEKHFQTSAVNVMKLLNSALNAIKSLRPNMTCECMYLYRVSQKKTGSQKNSNCSNSLNFEAKINCNTIKPNVPKWRKTCTGLKFDLLNFYGPQSNIHTFEIPVFFGPPCMKTVPQSRAVIPGFFESFTQSEILIHLTK